MPPASPNGEQAVNPDATSVAAPESLPGGQSESGADAKPSGADSSTATNQGEKQPATVYDAVLAVLDDQGKQGTTEAPAGESPAPKADGQESVQPGNTEGAGPAGDEGGAKPPKDAAVRVRELLAERRDFLPKAQRYDELSTWIREQGLTPQRVQYALQLEAMIANDPVRSLEFLQARIDEINRTIGTELPADLRDEVERGLLTDERAQELARLRNGGNVRDQRALERQRAQEQHQRETDERNAANQVVANIAKAVSDAEKSLVATDPDYPHIQKFVKARVRVLLDESTPSTPEEAVALYRQAVKDVKAEVTAIMPRRQPIDPLRPRQRTGEHANAAPKTPYEAAERALAEAQ